MPIQARQLPQALSVLIEGKLHQMEFVTHEKGILKGKSFGSLPDAKSRSNLLQT